MLAWQWQDKTINMVILSNTYSVVKTLLEAQLSVYSLRMSPFFLSFHGAGWEQKLREKLHTFGFCVFISISVVVALFGWDQRNRKIAECWKFSEAVISIKTCAKWGGYQYAIRKETSLGPHDMTRYLVPPEEIQLVHCLHWICGHREVCSARMTAWLPFVVVSRQSSPKKLLVVCRPIVGL